MDLGMPWPLNLVVAETGKAMPTPAPAIASKLAPVFSPVIVTQRTCGCYSFAKGAVILRRW